MNDKKVFKIFFGIIISSIVLIPICVNWGLMLGDTIPSVGDNGDWLSFYGSFFGGIIGGIATLSAVYFTITSVKNNARPVIVPLSVNLFGYIIKGNSVHISDEHKEESSILKYESSTDNHFSVINVGLETALNIKIIWDKEDYKDFFNLLKKLGYSEEDFKTLNESIRLKDKTEMPADYLLSVKSGGTNCKVEIVSVFKRLLEFLLLQQSKNCKDKSTIMLNNCLVYNEYKLTTIQIKYDDIYGNPYSEKYDILFRIQPYFIPKEKNYDEKVINLTMKKH